MLLLLLLSLFATRGATAQPVGLSYPALKATVLAEQGRYQARWENSDSIARKALLTESRAYLLHSLSTAYFPRWYGTQWDFNGITRTPGEGRIACGYFLTTVLQDAGFDLPRYKWAQLAAEPMILKMAPNAARFRDRDVASIEHWVRAQGEGLFAAGLDNHVGFILYRVDSVRFIHSNYYHPEIGVMSEPLDAAGPFANSRYRVIGKLFDDAMMRRWIQGAALGP